MPIRDTTRNVGAGRRSKITRSEKQGKTIYIGTQQIASVCKSSSRSDLMASEDHDVNEGALAVQRLLQRRNAEKEAGAILERIARDMSTSEVSGMPTSASTPIPTSQDFGDSSSTPKES